MIAILSLVALVAGIVDAIAGGGGLLTFPALFMATPDVRLALGTNKGKSVCGALMALVSYARSGHVDSRRAWPSLMSAGAGAFAGVKLVFALSAAVVRPVVFVLLVGVAVFFVARGRKRGRPSELPGESPKLGRPSFTVAHPGVVAAACGFLLGAYDGFLGPGVGTFLIAAHAAVFDDDLMHATANAKVNNFASNLVAVACFVAAGKIDLRLALPMADAQALGGLIGARVAVHGGERLVRVVALLVTFGILMRVGWQIVAHLSDTAGTGPACRTAVALDSKGCPRKGAARERLLGGPEPRLLAREPPPVAGRPGCAPRGTTQAAERPGNQPRLHWLVGRHAS